MPVRHARPRYALMAYCGVVPPVVVPPIEPVVPPIEPLGDVVLMPPLMPPFIDPVDGVLMVPVVGEVELPGVP